VVSVQPLANMLPVHSPMRRQWQERHSTCRGGPSRNTLGRVRTPCSSSESCSGKRNMVRFLACICCASLSCYGCRNTWAHHAAVVSVQPLANMLPEVEHSPMRHRLQERRSTCKGRPSRNTLGRPRAPHSSSGSLSGKWNMPRSLADTFCASLSCCVWCNTWVHHAAVHLLAKVWAWVGPWAMAMARFSAKP